MLRLRRFFSRSPELSGPAVKRGGGGGNRGSARSCQSDNGSFSQPPVSFCTTGKRNRLLASLSVPSRKNLKGWSGVREGLLTVCLWWVS